MKNQRIDGAVQLDTILGCTMRAGGECENFPTPENDCDARTHFRLASKDGLYQSPPPPPLQKSSFLKKKNGERIDISLPPFLRRHGEKSVIEWRKANTDCKRFSEATWSPLIVWRTKKKRPNIGMKNKKFGAKKWRPCAIAVKAQSEQLHGHLPVNSRLQETALQFSTRKDPTAHADQPL